MKTGSRNQQIGWRSFQGLHNSGRVKFRARGPERTEVDVYIQYVPPTGPLGQLGETFGVGSYFANILERDLQHFAHMVEQAPAGSLDPMSSHYLFHEDSATSRGQITTRQQQSMSQDPMMQPEILAARQARVERELQELQRQRKSLLEAKERKIEQERQLANTQREILAHEAEKRRLELQEQRARQSQPSEPIDPRYIYAAWAHALGDKDGRRARIPNFTQDPMTTRRPGRSSLPTGTSAPPPSPPGSAQ